VLAAREPFQFESLRLNLKGPTFVSLEICCRAGSMAAERAASRSQPDTRSTMPVGAMALMRSTARLIAA